jgi:hypothetical protein
MFAACGAHAFNHASPDLAARGQPCNLSQLTVSCLSVFSKPTASRGPNVMSFFQLHSKKFSKPDIRSRQAPTQAIKAL